MSFREVSGPNLTDVFCNFRSANDSLFIKNNQPLILTGSGKAAISMVLGYLKERGIISNKTDKILMAEWLGYWVYNQVNVYARPVYSLNHNPKVVMPYHQYGVPQKMHLIQEYADSIGATVIEDHAHALWMDESEFPISASKNLRIYSFSKFFFCYALGAVIGGDDLFTKFANREISKSGKFVSFFNNSVKLIDELALDKKLPNINLWKNLSSMAYALYNVGYRPEIRAIKLMQSKIDSEILVRKKRYIYFREQFDSLSVQSYLGERDFAPYIIPLMLPESIQESTLNLLRSAGYQTGIYHFDVNRNMLAPNYKKVLWLFLHGGMTDDDFIRQLEIVKTNMAK